MKNKKGITTQMLVILGAIVVGVVVLFVVIELANPDSLFVRGVLGFGKMICGFLSIMTGGWGAVVCNII